MEVVSVPNIQDANAESEFANEKIAVVTGASRGIGLGIVKEFCERKFNGTIYLTDPDVEEGRDVAKEVTKKYPTCSIRFHELDVTKQESISDFKAHLAKEHTGVDILINNAAIAYRHEYAMVKTCAEPTLKVNYFGVVDVCNALFPFLRKDARVVNISSAAGHLSRIPSLTIRTKMQKPYITVNELSSLVNTFLHDVSTGRHIEEGWGNSPYVVSKVAVCCLTRIQQREFDDEKPNRYIAVNSVHPGYARTTITGHCGKMSAKEAAKAPVDLALGRHTHKGEFVWSDLDAIEWDNSFVPPADQFLTGENYTF